MPSGEKCIFNQSWVLKEGYKTWLTSAASNKHRAYCKICSKKVTLLVLESKEKYPIL